MFRAAFRRYFLRKKTFESMNKLDKFLNNLPMYRLVLYGLIGLEALAAVLGLAGVLSYKPQEILAPAAVLLFVCYLANKLCALLYNAATNSESYLITALILALILPPTTSPEKLAYIALAGFVAVISKFVITFRHKHIFNPAAFGAAALSLAGLLSVTWWVGTPALIPYTFIFGFLIIRKIHRTSLAVAFFVSSMAMLAFVGAMSGQPVLTLIKNAVISGPLLFFAGVMLTEPATMPSSRYRQTLFGVMVGALYTSQLRYGDFSTSPHMVLLAGNVFAFAVNQKRSYVLRLKQKVQISSRVYDFIFEPNRRLSFIPGQYMEWTLAHKKVDSRGNRRSFTIASSPTEADVHIGVKFYEPSSSYKKALLALQPGQKITASGLAGSFGLPTDEKRKLVFIAGGIGITPFRSMLKYLEDMKISRDIVLFYGLSSPDEMAYKDVLRAANERGVRIIPLVMPNVLDISKVKQYVPDYAERLFYISGPNGMVEANKKMLHEAGIAQGSIVTDYFSGY